MATNKIKKNKNQRTDRKKGGDINTYENSITELTKELDVTNEKQLKCLYSNESSLGNKVEKLELLGQDTKQDTEERNMVKQKS